MPESAWRRYTEWHRNHPREFLYRGLLILALSIVGLVVNSSAWPWALLVGFGGAALFLLPWWLIQRRQPK